MVPDPLHPAVVHLPIALAVLLPLFSALGLLAVRRRFLPARSWCLVVLLAGLLAASAWAAKETGEDQDERVEDVVAERFIEEHHETADRFFVLAVVAWVVSGAGLLSGRRGEWARVATVAASLAVLGGGVLVGRSGGELVYRHGAAQAYMDKDAGVAGGTGARTGPEVRHREGGHQH